MFVKAQEPVFGGAFHRGGAAERGARGDQVGRAEGGAAAFALVAVGVGVAAIGAGADDVAVGEKLAGDFVEILLRDLFGKLVVFQEFTKKVLRGRVVQRLGGAVVYIEGDTNLFEGIADLRVVFIDDLARGDVPFLPGAHRDGGPVFVGAANEHHVFAHQPQVAHINISRQISAGEVPDVQGAVGIGAGRR